jgi:hypothetical protein
MAVIAYEHPVTGAAPPTALQAKEQVTFNIIATASAGVTVTATHNMGITSAELALGFPEVILEPLWGASGTEALVDAGAWVCTNKDTATVQLTKAATGGCAAAVLRVHVLRPHTIGR